ncbi:MAG: penicillin-binding protein [Cyclobacteriaceae bacterium]|jgi:penicillin-binding protein 1A|nr:penicillin-binding protein [Cyclobacteriaceae bacterium]
MRSRYLRYRIKLKRKLELYRPYWEPIYRWWRRINAKIDFYFKTHPRERKAAITLGILAGPPCSFLFMLLLLVWIETPSRYELRNIQNQVASEVYSADSVLLGRYFLEDRTEIDYEEISPAVIKALIATEDVRFYRHAGVDYRSLGRVLVKSVFLQEESAGGGSTLTQQLSKNLYPRKKYWILSMLINKLREVRNAIRLESLYTKDELLTLYLNTVPFPDNVFGIQQAAQRFYGIPASELSIEQAATLIGTLKATHTYNPRLFPDRALARRNVVFLQMVKDSVLSSAEADSLKKLPLNLNYTRVSLHEGLAPYFREFLKAELLKWCEQHEKENGDPYNLFTDGLKIYTTIDSRMQAYAEQAIATQMAIVQQQFFEHWGKDKPWRGREFILDEAIKRSPRYFKLQEEGMEEEEILEALSKPIPTKLFAWQGEKEVAASPIDSIIHHLQYLNAGFVVMDPSNGQVKAWVGGIAHDYFQYDHVKITTKRQVGSTFKPIVYAMALEQGVDPCELIPANQETYIDDENKEWRPRNAQNDYRVRYTMPGALAYSVNTVAVKLIMKAGVENTIRLAQRMGIISKMPPVPSISLGSSSISLLEMATAFSCFANEGKTSLPYFINNIHDLEGNVINDFKPAASGQQVLSKESALLTRSMLQTVVSEGTAARMRYRYQVYNDMGGKTGTTQSNADGWFIGITPTLVMGCWVGADDPRIRFRLTSLGQGSNTALPIAAYFMQQLNKDSQFESVTKAKFNPLPEELRQRMACDLYELDDDLIDDILITVHQRDSLIRFREQVLLTDSLAADTIAIPQETYLQQLYRRKLRVNAARTRQDSIRTATQLNYIGG